MILYDVGVKSPNYDAYGLLRALHSHNPGIIYMLIYLTCLFFQKMFPVRVFLTKCMKCRLL